MSGVGWGRLGVCVSRCGVGWFTNLKPSNRISWFIQVLSCFNRFGGPPWGGWDGWVCMWVWVGGGVSTNLKSSNRIEMSWFVQFWLTFDWFQRSPLLAGGCEWMGVRVCQHVWGDVLCTCVCACTCMHACKWWCDNGISQGIPYGSSHLHEIIMFIPICTCAVYMCACMCTCVEYPPNTLTDFHSHPPIPHPQGRTPEISQNSIKIEWIKIFQFCLKIWDLWTLVHSYRPHLVCRWGVSHHK